MTPSPFNDGSGDGEPIKQSELQSIMIGQSPTHKSRTIASSWYFTILQNTPKKQKNKKTKNEKQQKMQIRTARKGGKG